MKKYLFILALAVFSLSSCATRVVVPAPQANVTIIKKAPRHHKVVVVKGKRYHYWNGKYHRKTRQGYVVAKI